MTVTVLKDAFPYLSDNDLALLLEQGREQRFEAGATILAHEARECRLIIVKEGHVRVERDAADAAVVLARLGPGELIGEISFVERMGATASVRADGPVTVDIIDEADLEALATADPGFAARFYQSIALVLAARMRESTERLAALGPQRLARTTRAGRAEATRGAPATTGASPPALVAELAAFTGAMRDLEARLGGAGTATDADSRAVAEACDGLVALLDRTDGGTGGGAILRETYPVFMRGALVARIHEKPRGFPEDYDTVAAIYAEEPAGEGALGPLIDGWFLDRPLCRARRSAKARLVQHLAAALDGASCDAPAGITALAAGTAEALFDLLAERPDADIQATCVDLDDEALLAGVHRARRRGCADRLRFVQADVRRLVDGGERLALEPQALVYALGLCEYLEDDEVVRLLDWAHGRLRPGGALCLATLDAGNPDRRFMAHVLEWYVAHRTAEQMRDLFAQSAFGDRAEIVTDGAGLLAMAAR